jgi:signal peptidase I
MMPRKSVSKKTFRSTIGFASITIFLMVAPALASAYFGFGIFTVMSQSMKPYMSAGDEILTDVVSAHDVQAGDVILFINPDNLEQIAHRVIKSTTVDNQSYTITTKGDSNPAVDTPTLTYNANAPIRRVIAVVPVVGYFLDAVSSTATKTVGSIGLIAYLAFLIRKARRDVEPELTPGALAEAEISKRVEQLVKEHLKSISVTHALPVTVPSSDQQDRQEKIYI